MKIAILLAGSRAGSDFFASLLDGHSQICQFPGDFAKEIWKKYPNLKLLGYGFHWKEDPLLKNNCDNSNWFLFNK